MDQTRLTGIRKRNSRPGHPSPASKKSVAAATSVDYRSRLIAARMALGLSRRKMANKLSTPYATYEQWESGRFRTPAVAAIAAELMAGIEALRDLSSRPNAGT
jgi:DNA-binding transcriptional regulator YiaG